MAQGLLPYKYEEATTASGMTSLAGLPVYLDLASMSVISLSILPEIPSFFFTLFCIKTFL